MLDLDLDAPGIGVVFVVVEQHREVGVFGADAADIVPGAPDDGPHLGVALVREGRPDIGERRALLRQKGADRAGESRAECSAERSGPSARASANTARTDADHGGLGDPRAEPRHLGLLEHAPAFVAPAVHRRRPLSALGRSRQEQRGNRSRA